MASVVHVSSLCHVTDLKKHGFHPILHRFMEDIEKFENDIAYLTEGRLEFLVAFHNFGRLSSKK